MTDDKINEVAIDTYYNSIVSKIIVNIKEYKLMTHATLIANTRSNNYSIKHFLFSVQGIVDSSFTFFCHASYNDRIQCNRPIRESDCYSFSKTFDIFYFTSSFL